MKKILNFLGVCFIAVSLIFTIITIIACFRGSIIDTISIIGVVGIVGVMVIVGAMLLLCGQQKEKRRKIAVVSMIIMAILYSCIVLYVVVGGDRSIYRNNMASINLIPFKTIGEYINAYFNNSMNKDIILSNVIGNIAIFAPYGIFFPFIFKNYRNWGNFIITIIALLIGVEVIQLMFNLGSFDIDDLILNMIGVIVTYSIFRNKKVVNLLEKIGIY